MLNTKNFKPENFFDAKKYFNPKKYSRPKFVFKIQPKINLRANAHRNSYPELNRNLKRNPKNKLFTCLQDKYCQFFRALLEASCQIRLRPYQREPVFDEIAPKFRFVLF